MIATALAASLNGTGTTAAGKEERADDDYSFMGFVTLARCVVQRSWGCIIQQLCTDGVLTTAWRPLFLPCNVWYTINPSPAG